MSLLSQGVEIPFTYGFFKSRSPQLSIQQCVNYRPNSNIVGALSMENLYQTEGIKEAVSSSAQEPCRGSHTMNGKPYFVIGTKLYRVDQTISTDLTVSYSKAVMGFVDIEGDGRVQMASIWTGAGYELSIVVPGQNAYIYQESTGFVTPISGFANFLSPVDDVVSINGFFVFLQTGQNKIFHSNLNNGLVYNATDFELVTRTEKLVGLLNYRDQLYVMGEDQILPYGFIGGANFVFQYQRNSTIPIGLESKWGKAIFGGSMFFFGGGRNESPGLWQSNGSGFQRVSTEAIEYIARTQLDINSAYVQAFSINGGRFVALYVGEYCFVYDLGTQRWHQRNSRVNDRDIPWRANTITKAYGEIFTGDAIDGRVGYLDIGNTEYGGNVHRSFMLQPFDNKGRHIPLTSIVLAADVGFDGEFVLSWSDDGYIFSDGLQRSAGAVGDYGRHIRWDRLGSSSFARSLRFGTSSDAPANINKVIALS